MADSEASYISVVGANPVDLEDEPAPIDALPVDREAAAAIASTQSPTVKIAAADVDVSAAEARGSRASFYPRFDVELNGNAADDVGGVEGTDFSASALVVMRYNLYRGGADIAREREAFHRSNESRALLRQIRRASEEEARVSFNALETARARTQALRDRVEAQRRTRDAYGSQFEIGQRDLLDLLDAENELLLARVSLTTAEFTEQFAVYRVLAVVGSLIDTVDLAKPRETISIHRTPEDVQTPEAIESKSIDQVHPRAEPRPLRGEEAGEPPIDALDAATEINETFLYEDADSQLADIEPAAGMADAPVLQEPIQDSDFVPAAFVEVERVLADDVAPIEDAKTADIVETDDEIVDAADDPVTAFFAKYFGAGGKGETQTQSAELVDKANFSSSKDEDSIEAVSNFLDQMTSK